MPRGAMVAQHAIVQTSGLPGAKGPELFSAEAEFSSSGAPGSAPAMERGLAKDVVADERSVAKSIGMKKIYEKPTLVKRGRLTSATAQIVASGVILGE
ncbi:hypothetical protein [Mesorhizobium neociceri]|uniref:Uncharacterized protein n=1 Tax=Mesorhizobium neociceri TaxID=1307853 RepID=A0A838B0Z0_9HYPH|nr:hypothetical protein [Mesorhizobium neociceri]MBA1139504.1 hypothetical protein [Mesorhizobium neociceri]